MVVVALGELVVLGTRLSPSREKRVAGGAAPSVAPGRSALLAAAAPSVAPGRSAHLAAAAPSVASGRTTLRRRWVAKGTCRRQMGRGRRAGVRTRRSGSEERRWGENEGGSTPNEITERGTPAQTSNTEHAATTHGDGGRGGRQRDGPGGRPRAARRGPRRRHVVVFEKSGRVGGIWAYDPRPDNGCLYESLRTNLPRELMAFSGCGLAGRVFAGDRHMFPGHQEMLAFLDAFADESGIAERVRLHAEVLRVVPGLGLGQGEEGWKVTWRREDGGEVAEEVFDAVVVCNGHHMVPLLPRIQDCIQDDGKVHFAEGSTLVADGLLYCTGYLYDFPFIDLDGFTVDDNRVGPLYKHTYELQSKWVARVLSGRGAALPSEEDMLASVQEHYREMEEAGKAKRRTHVVMPEWVGYMNWLADQVGEPHLEPRRRDVYEKALMCVFSVDEGYRDKWNKEEDEKNHTTS
nr:unnamed protein product [Digitaria exilis]